MSRRRDAVNQRIARCAGRVDSRTSGETAALTVRISRTDWMRLHQLALSERLNLQAIAIDGFSEVLERHGLPPIT